MKNSIMIKEVVKKLMVFKNVYIQNLIKKNKVKKKIKTIVACGNGTAGIFAPDILRGIGCEVYRIRL